VEVGCEVGETFDAILVVVVKTVDEEEDDEEDVVEEVDEVVLLDVAKALKRASNWDNEGPSKVSVLGVAQSRLPSP
jgi:hypothetical protein